MHKFPKSTSKRLIKTIVSRASSRLTTFVPSITMTALTKAVEKQDKKSSAFRKSSHALSLGEELMKACRRLCLL